MIKFILILIFFWMSFIQLSCFEKCGHGILKNINDKIINKNQDLINSNNIIIIPVLVHIIYKEPSELISHSQVLSQINVLNEDFRKMYGTPGYNTNPVGIDTKLEFRLANKDETGNDINGISYHYSNITSYDIGDINEVWDLANISYGDSSKYLNIWVLPDPKFWGYSVVGVAWSKAYSLYPKGIYVRTTAFGDKVGNVISPYHLGRTSTHELGHYFGLFHIFDPNGDCTNNNCNLDGDKICDTPIQENFTSGCPGSSYSCGNSDMIENYMDYTDDECMNIFTIGQSSRMFAHFQNYDFTLENSPGLTKNDFIIFGNHIGTYNYNASTKIKSKASLPYSNFILSSGDSISLTSKIEVELNSGVEIKSGSYFHANIESQLTNFKNSSIHSESPPYNQLSIISINPNPVSGQSNISLKITQKTSINSLVLYDNMGNEIFSFFSNQIMDVGTYKYNVNGNNLNSGLYLMVFKSEYGLITKKFINIK